MKKRLVLFAIFTALVLSVTAAPASPAADPENFRVSLRVTVVNCVGVNLLHCAFEGSEVVAHLGRATVEGEITKGCAYAFDYCIWALHLTMTPTGSHAGRTLVVDGDVNWTPSTESAPLALSWTAQEDSGYIGHGMSTDDFSQGQPYGSEFTINLTGTLRLAT